MEHAKSRVSKLVKVVDNDLVKFELIVLNLKMILNETLEATVKDEVTAAHFNYFNTQFEVARNLNVVDRAKLTQLMCIKAKALLMQGESYQAFSDMMGFGKERQLQPSSKLHKRQAETLLIVGQTDEASDLFEKDLHLIKQLQTIETYFDVICQALKSLKQSALMKPDICFKTQIRIGRLELIAAMMAPSEKAKQTKL